MPDRPPFRRTLYILALALLAALPAAAQQDMGTFVVLSDIHFDPFYDPGLKAQLEAADARQWQRIFESSKVTQLSNYGADTNYPLLKSALSSLRCRTPEPDFVLISGDFLAHGFPQDETWVRKTLEFLTLRLQATFPGLPVLPALGNNDSACGDYTMQPGGPLLTDLAGIWRPLLGPEAGTWAQSFPAGGYYSVPHPTVPKTRLAVLNTVLFSPKYQNCGQAPADPGRDELAWLAETLKQAAANGEKVWTLYHIPQAVDVYSTLSHSQPTTMWKDEYSSAFSGMADPGLVTASFSGHTHMDEFRLPPSGGFVHGTPAVSPLFGNNPGYQIFSYSRSTGALLDYRAFFLNLGAGLDPDLPWAREYDFQTAYGQSAYDRDALQAVVTGMKSEASPRNRFLLLYPTTSSQGGADPCRWQAYWCGIGEITPKDFLSCLCVPGFAPWASGGLCPAPAAKKSSRKGS
ncbi:MAG TPA: metallophosphoesterase [Thermoanaerobaculia bacterium]|nr:metallophosphoesterase [Thermoanaerobaculia bacterium]